MASAITCNFPTCCAGCHRRGCETLGERLLAATFELGRSDSFVPTEWHIWKRSLPERASAKLWFLSALNLGIVVTGTPPHPPCNVDAPTPNLCFLHLTHILIHPFKPAQKRQLWNPDICFHIAERYPIFPSTPLTPPPPFSSLQPVL